MTPIIVFMTTGSKREAQRIAQTLLKKRLIACANIYGPVESHFWWQSKIEKAKEFFVLMKSRQNLFVELSKTVKKIHSYEVPEILGVSIVEGFQPYLDWLDSVLATSGEN
jgi:periplasmic divalent cation tolerance protein